MVTSAIERSLMSNTVVLPARAGFLRRALAFAIDVLVIALVVEVLVILAYGPSGGQVQGSGIYSHSDCQTQTSSYSVSIERPQAQKSSETSYTTECFVSLFGYRIGHLITVGRITD